eukprot:Hpha_TRINITY_DN15770_c6_g12::TRINITY_DN15770_c6_g12_i1::g.41398::m.41398
MPAPMSKAACDVMQQASLLAAQTVLQAEAEDRQETDSKSRAVARQKYSCAAQETSTSDGEGSQDTRSAAQSEGWGDWSISAATREEDTSSEWVGKNICRHWAKGYCNRGQSCHFSHAGPSPNRVLCPDAGAPLVVNSAGGSLPTDEELKRGDKFIVVKSTLPCKDYAAGECYRGDHCRFAHIGSGASCLSQRDQRQSSSHTGSSHGSECDSQNDSYGASPPRHYSRTSQQMQQSPQIQIQQSQQIGQQVAHHVNQQGGGPSTIVIVSAPPSYSGCHVQSVPMQHTAVRTVRYVYSQGHQQQPAFDYAPLPQRVEHCGYSDMYECCPPPPPPSSCHVSTPPPEVIYGYRGPNEHAIPGYGVGHGA